MKPPRVIRCRKGGDTAPLLMVFCAICMALTALIVFPGITEFKETTDTGKAIKELQRLKDAMKEMQAASEVGAIEKMELDVPAPYCIRLDSAGSSAKIVTGASGGQDYICGKQKVALIHEEGSIKVIKK
jgi:hypothetical protein